MTMRYAEIKDYPWLRKHDENISDEVLNVKIESKEIYVVQKEEQLVGWLRYNLFWDIIPFMNMLYFIKEHQHKGNEKQLLHYWELEMRQRGYKNVLTSVQLDKETQDFYEKMGYAKIGGIRYLCDTFEMLLLKNI